MIWETWHFPWKLFTGWSYVKEHFFLNVNQWITVESLGVNMHIAFNFNCTVHENYVSQNFIMEYLHLHVHQGIVRWSLWLNIHTMLPHCIQLSSCVPWELCITWNVIKANFHPTITFSMKFLYQWSSRHPVMVYKHKCWYNVAISHLILISFFRKIMHPSKFYQEAFSS
jgi:hypothetical protein